MFVWVLMVALMSFSDCKASFLESQEPEDFMDAYRQCMQAEHEKREIIELQEQVDRLSQEKNIPEEALNALLPKAIEYDQAEILQQLLDLKADPHGRCGVGMSPLKRAIRKHNSAALQTLLDAKADVNRVDEFYDSALHCAAEERDPEFVRSLLAARANIYKHNNKGETALIKARSKLKELEAELQESKIKDISYFEAMRPYLELNTKKLNNVIAMLEAAGEVQAMAAEPSAENAGISIEEDESDLPPLLVQEEKENA